MSPTPFKRVSQPPMGQRAWTSQGTGQQTGQLSAKLRWASSGGHSQAVQCPPPSSAPPWGLSKIQCPFQTHFWFFSYCAHDFF